MPIYRLDENQESGQLLLEEYEHFLSGKAEGTIEAYPRTVRHVMEWVSDRPGNGGYFQPHQLTKTAVEMYLASLEDVDDFAQDVLNKATSCRGLLFQGNSGWGGVAVPGH
jgi:hypothetical protein